MRAHLTILAGVLAALAFLPANADDGSEPIVLQIPQLEFNLDANLAATIETPNFEAMNIRISRTPQQVSYGSIYSKINTESANIVMTVSSDEQGILCKFDLGHRAGFHMHPGRNSVELEYKDGMERVHYASFILQTEEKAPAPARHINITPDRAAAGKFAVVIGIAQYQNSGSGLSNLQFADKDAQDFRDFLLSPEGGSFQKDHVRVLLDADATSQNVRSAFYTFLTQAQPTDEVVIYIAGHGAPDPNDPRNLYLLTYDTKLDDMGGTAFPMRQIQDVFANVLKAKRVVTFADTCHSFGFSGARARGKKNTNSNNLVNQYMAHYANDSARAVITASDVSQLSYESDQFGGGHGVFTYYLLKGLHGEADANKDGTVTAGELFAYVHDNVAKATSGNQSPMAGPGLAERIPLAGSALKGAARASTETPAVSRKASGALLR
ncbi:MAG: caspase family protein [Candidatus Acidiferrum sp.]|jgi:uncharacterized caspase-like protein